MGKNGKSGSKTASGYQAPIGTYSQAPKKTVDFKIVEKDNETWEVQNTLDLDEPLFTVTVHNNDSHKYQLRHVVGSREFRGHVHQPANAQ